jgi:hypothetical protein
MNLETPIQPRMDTDEHGWLIRISQNGWETGRLARSQGFAIQFVPLREIGNQLFPIRVYPCHPWFLRLQLPNLE